MKNNLQAVADLLTKWSVLSEEQLSQINAALERADLGTVTKQHHQGLLRKYKAAKISLQIGLAGVILTTVLGIPGIYFYAKDQSLKDQLISSRLFDIESLRDEKHFAAARALLEDTLLIDPDHPTLRLARLDIDLTEAITTGIVTDDLIARARLALEEYPDSIGINSHLGSVLYFRGKYDEAIKHHEKSLELAKSIQASELAAKSSVNIGVLYIELQRFDAAAQKLEEAVSVFCEIEDSSECSTALYELARLHFSKQNYSECVTVLSRVKKRTAVRVSTLAATNLLMGECSFPDGKLEEARIVLDESSALFESISDSRGQALSKATLAQVVARENECDYARLLAENSRMLAKRSEIDMILVRTIGISSDVELNCRNLIGAYRYAWMALKAVESIGATAFVEFAKSEAEKIASQIENSKLEAVQSEARLELVSLGLLDPSKENSDGTQGPNQ